MEHIELFFVPINEVSENIFVFWILSLWV